jgi:hypothetical protein
VRRHLLARSAADGLLFVSELGPPTAAAASDQQQDSSQQQPAGSSDEGEGGSGSIDGTEAGSDDMAAGSGERRAKTPKMDHLVCFLPGTLALGYLHGVNTGIKVAAPAVDIPLLRVGSRKASSAGLPPMCCNCEHH